MRINGKFRVLVVLCRVSRLFGVFMFLLIIMFVRLVLVSFWM